VLADGSLPNPLDPLEDERWPLRGAVFYSRPFGNDRSDQPTLLIPQGSVAGALATLLMTVGGLTFAPTLQLLRETSSSESVSGQIRNRISGSAWTEQPSIDVAVPLGARFELTPQVGYAFGSVNASVTQTAVRRGRVVGQGSSFSDGVRGQWISVQLSAGF